jgi:glutathione S-transferase
MSSNARRVMLAAVHLGVHPELVKIDLTSGDDRRRLAEINPNSKVPVLEDDGFLLWESCAIMQYLADRTPGQSVYPPEPRGRADVNRWMFWASQHFSPAIAIFTWERIWKKLVEGTDPDPVELARGNAEFAAAAAVLDGHLATREWLVGDSLTLADFAVAAPLMYSERAGLPVAGYRNLSAWFDRVQQLPAWRETSPWG